MTEIDLVFDIVLMLIIAKMLTLCRNFSYCNNHFIVINETHLFLREEMKKVPAFANNFDIILFC